MEKINAIGQACPIPVIKAKKGLQNHDQIEILVDNEIAVQNLKKMATQLNYSYQVQQKDSEFIVEMAKAGKGGQVTVQEKPVATVVEAPTNPDLPTGRIEPASAHQLQLSQGYIVVIGTDTMGQGDEKLGQTLLKSFIYSLTAQDILPEYVLFYNGGVKLVAEGSESADDLDELQKLGVKVLVCGVCVDYYGLKDKVSTDNITNMFHIVELMRGAQRIVRP